MTIKPVHPRVVQVFLAILFTLAGLVATLLTAYGQTPRWSQPIPLSSSESKSWFPDVAADTTGQVHVVWASTTEMAESDSHPTSGYDVVMYTTSSNGQTWSQAIDIAAFGQRGESTEATRPTALIDQHGMLHLTFRSTDVFYLQAPVDSLLSNVSRLSPHRVSTGDVAYFSRLAFDGHRRLHLVYSQLAPVGTSNCQISYHLFSRWSDDGGFNWSAPTDITNLPTGAAKPQMVIDGQDYIHVVWEAGCDGSYGHVLEPRRVMYSASHDGGMTWTSPIEFVAPGGRAANISLGLDGQDKLVVAWLGLPEDVVYYQFSGDHGRSWSPPQPIAGLWGGSSVYGTLLDDYAMATDGAGNVHLILVGRVAADQKTLSVLHLTWDGTTWSNPEAITTLIGDVPEWPRVSVGLGNQLHVVWFVRDQAHVWDTSGNYRIWYARGVASAPALAPVAWPTRTPTPEPKSTESFPTATPTRTPTPTPTLDPALASLVVPPQVIDSLYTDSDELVLLAKSLIPVVLIVAGVIVGVRMRRR